MREKNLRWRDRKAISIVLPETFPKAHQPVEWFKLLNPEWIFKKSVNDCDFSFPPNLFFGSVDDFQYSEKFTGVFNTNSLESISKGQGKTTSGKRIWCWGKIYK